MDGCHDGQCKTSYMHTYLENKSHSDILILAFNLIIY